MSGRFLPVGGGEAAVRDWFHRLSNARENPETLAESREWIQRLLAVTEKSPQTPFCKGGLGGVSVPPKPDPIHADLIAFHAPLALVEGAWLESVALAANAYREPVNQLFACYLALLGRDEADSPAFSYRGWLRLCQTSLPDASAWRFAHDSRVGASALYFSCLQLAMGLHSANFLPETVGFTLAYLNSESPWRLSALPASKRKIVFASMSRHVENALLYYPHDSKEWPRVGKGYALYQTNENDYLDDLQRFTQSRATLAEQVGVVIRRKLGFAQGYHSGVKLGGRVLEEWFADNPFDTIGFLDAFSSSIYAKGQKGQRLFDQINDFGGSMFGVFDREELGLVDAWLDEVGQGHNQWERFSTATPSNSPACKALPQLGQSSAATPGDSRACKALPQLGWTRFEQTDNRALFNLLINQDAQAKTLAAARLRVEQVLARSSHPSQRRKVPLQKRFFDYSPQTLAQTIVQIHAEEIAKHKPFKAPPHLRREEYVWGIRQFAPAILVDGCWLQHMGGAATQDCRIQRLLYRIYAEELGEGFIDWNHPKIYRDLLNDLRIDLPSVETLAFAREPSLLDSSFDLPSYLLAISQFPKTYLPEILGLNLAIELSGLGVGYMRLAEELRYWNINPKIITLHLSIDNLAGGHSAMACEAIQLFMDGILCLGGVAMQDAIWRRVWSGYLSLKTATRRFQWALALGFCRHFLPQRLFSKWPRLKLV